MNARALLSMSGVAGALLGVMCFGAGDSPSRDSAEFGKDTQLRAMADELARSKTLALNNLDKPYFIQYTTGDTEEMVVAASLGGITRSSRLRFRSPGVEVRVGDYKFDNTNSVYSGFPRIGLFPLDDDYAAMRNDLWQTTDLLYKAGTDQITRKRNALREMAAPDATTDLAPAKAVRLLEAPAKLNTDTRDWESALRRASERFVSHSGVMTSSVRVQEIASTYRLVNSEGTLLRFPQNLNEIEIRASGVAPDGSRIWDHRFITAADSSDLPKEDQLAKAAEAVASETEALSKAPLAEDYSGPVLFEGEAAAEMMAQVVTEAVTLHRKPITPPGSNGGNLQTIESVWSSRIGSKVAPDWLTVFDNPLAQTDRGVALAGHYTVDDEGVPAQRVELVDKGTFKSFLLSREPVRTFNGSNGHGRLPGPFGAEAAVIGNLFVETAQQLPEAQLKAKLMEAVKSAGLKYGLVIRRLDFPSTATFGELQSMARQLQQNGYARTLNSPLLVYRVFPDGHEELVRGLRFREFSAKDLRDLEAASDQPYVLNYVTNGSGFNHADLRSEITTSSVICPSLLFTSVDMARAENEADKRPLVPPPALTVQR